MQEVFWDCHEKRENSVQNVKIPLNSYKIRVFERVYNRDN